MRGILYLVEKKILARSREEVLLQTFLTPLGLGVINFRLLEDYLLRTIVHGIHRVLKTVARSVHLELNEKCQHFALEIISTRDK
ncbi:MAG: hypothetical protein COA78_16610 [Blastopirellula sp.]|nr:MAG: hypothetical protein COA78_16610 [Blastopirellula sp.]